MYAGDGDAHTSDIHDEAPVAVDAYDVALEAGIKAGDETQLDISSGVIFEGVQKETDSFGRCFRHTHERLHDAVGDDGGPMRAAVVHEVESGMFFVEVALQCRRWALQKDETADGGLFF